MSNSYYTWYSILSAWLGTCAVLLGIWPARTLNRAGARLGFAIWHFHRTAGRVAGAWWLALCVTPDGGRTPATYCRTSSRLPKLPGPHPCEAGPATSVSLVPVTRD